MDIETINGPLKLTDFQKMYNNIMNSDVTTWKLVSFLQTCKRELPGFDYEIHYAQDGYPDGIMFMTAQMKNNLMRYGDIMFLDSQNNSFNKIGWPYIGIALHNNTHKVCVCCESIVNAEKLEMYIWLLKTMSKLEPR